MWTLLAISALAQAQPPRPHFTDVASRSRFAYVTNNGFDGKRKYFLQPLCGGVAVLDFDNDGLLDLFFTNGAQFPELTKTRPDFHNTLLRNKGSGAFEDVTERAGLAGESLGYSLGVAAADFDNDGFTDLLIANAGPNTLYRNQGDGSFRDVTANAGLTKPEGILSVQGAWLDYDNDGLLDLVVSNYTTWTVATDRRCVREDNVDFYCHPKTYPAVPHRLYHNLGDGRFQDVSEAAGFLRAKGKGMGIAIADINGDGRPDIFIANDTEPNFLYINRGDGTFQERGLALGVAYDDSGATVSAMGADARDYDNDGQPDIFYNNLISQVWGLFRNLGRSFRYTSTATSLAVLSSPYSGWSAGFIDYNNDGWRDLYSANGDVDSLRQNAEQHDTLFENQGGKRFIDVSRQAGPHFTRRGYQRGAAFADLNNDGFLDIVVTSLQRRPAILLNSGITKAHWIALRLTGTRSNRDAIGASIRITTAAGRVLSDQLSPSTGLLSSSTKQVHFGLGTETKVAEIEVRWPSGVVSRITDMAGVDTVVSMQESRR
ncbi:MAG: CRTAC1 family protein [Acidobacteria bacterium]|nr:CRTAC1 family protein [Acidobacteriota bacterium]